MLILTNSERFPPVSTAPNGDRIRTVFTPALRDILRRVKESDLLLINCAPTLVYELAAVFALFPNLRRPIVASDLVLRTPEGFAQSMALPIKRVLLRRVDHFIHHFRFLEGYEQVYGIGPDRSSFVPFKPNLRYRQQVSPNPDGDYILCFGRAMRDFDTFFAAVEQLPYPAAIAKPDFQQLRAHGSRFTRPQGSLPKQVAVLDHDPNDSASQLQILANARLVVIPLLRKCLVGVGTSLNAMLLGKCVILSEGPATKGLYTNEVLAVPPEDPQALAEMIDRSWRDTALRDRTASAGYRYAAALGGEPELRQRLLDQAVQWSQSRPVRHA